MDILVHHLYFALANAFDVSDGGVDFISGFEGFRETYYRDSAGLWMIGYGHLCGKSKCPDIQEHVSVADAKALLRQDSAKATKSVKPLPNLNQDRLDALTSFAFNLGCGVIPSSGIPGMLLALNFRAVGDKILKYDHAGGKEIQGLTRRHKAERALFCRSGGCLSMTDNRGSKYLTNYPGASLMNKLHITYCILNFVAFSSLAQIIYHV